MVWTKVVWVCFGLGYHTTLKVEAGKENKWMV